MIRKTLTTVLVLLVLLVVALTANALRQGSRQLQVQAPAPRALDKQAVAERLAQAVRLQTVSSRDDASLNRDQFFALHELLQRQFPRAHARLGREQVGELSLLYRWEGTDTAAAPVLLLAHQDVVPVAPGTEGDWEVSPFAGEIRDGFIWGRGAWDDKGNLMAQMEAVEMLLAAGWQPERTIYLAYGADEEVGGLRGAARISALLASRGVKPAFVLDEGLLVLEGILPGLKAPAALIGVAEKGYLSVQLTTRATPGHSSMPPRRGTSAIALLSRALADLEREQMPAAIGGVAQEMFDTLAPEMDLLPRILLSNLWLTRPLVQRQLERASSTNALLRTTTALTMLSAGNKDNVLPGRAEATINFRILPGDTRAGVLEHVRTVVGRTVPPDQFELQEIPGGAEASKVASSASVQYQVLGQTIREVFPDSVVAPGLMVAATDSVHYDAVSDHVFKFSPIRAASGDLGRFHGTNERLSVDGYADAIRFYHRLLPRLAAAAL